MVDHRPRRSSCERVDHVGRRCRNPAPPGAAADVWSPLPEHVRTAWKTLSALEEIPLAVRTECEHIHR